jgi:hypothetical protein
MTELSRRHLLTGTVSVIGITGCLQVEDRHRGLGFRPFNIPERDGSVVFRIEIRASFSRDGASADWATFHDVELVAYSDEREEMCRESIGVVSEQQMDGETVELRCPDYPAVIQFEAAESPCAEDTTIKKAVRTEDNGEIIYSIQDRGCETTA